jgi:hypothetical protein
MAEVLLCYRSIARWHLQHSSGQSALVDARYTPAGVTVRQRSDEVRDFAAMKRRIDSRISQLAQEVLNQVSIRLSRAVIGQPWTDT